MAFRNSVGLSQTTTASSTVTLTVPTGVIATDVALVGWGRPNGTLPTITPSSSNGSAVWTVITAPTVNTNHYYAWFLLTGVVAGDTITLTMSGAAAHTVGADWYSGLTTTGYVKGTVTARASSVTTITAAGLTSTTDGSTVLVGFIERLGTGQTVAPTLTGATTTVDAWHPASGGTGSDTVACASFTAATAGATSSVTATYGAASSNAVGIQIALAPVVTATAASGGASVTFTAGATATPTGGGAATVAFTAAAAAAGAATSGATLSFATSGSVGAFSVTSTRVGGVTSTGFSANVDAVNASGVRLAVSASSSMTSPTYNSGSTTTPDGNGLATLSITGLTADTDYWWQFEVNGTLTGPIGRVHTFPSAAAAGSYSFIAGSCLASSANPAAFDNARTRTNPTTGKRALFNVLLGDLHYDNISTAHPGAQSLAYNLASWRNQFGQARLSQLAREIPLVLTMSDHDYGADNTAGADANGQYYLATYRAMAPHYPLVPDTNGDTGLSGSALGIYQTWNVGRVCYIVTDGRSYMSPIANTDNSSKTKLGATQKQWFKDTALAAKNAGRVVVWFHEDGWNNASTFGGDDTWSAYTTERSEIGTYLSSNSIKVYYISGDWHVLEADTGAGNQAGGFPMVCVSPWQQTTFKGNGSFSQGYYPNPTSGTVQNQYGWFNVDDSGSTVVIAFTGYNATSGTDSSVITMSTTFDLSTPATATATVAFTAAGAAKAAPTAGVTLSFGTATTPNALPTAAATFSVSTTAAAAAVPGAAAAVSFAATANVTVPTVQGATFALSAAVTASAPAISAAAVAYTAQATPGSVPATASAALTFTTSGSGTARPSSTATLQLVTAATAASVAAASALVAFTAATFPPGTASGTAILAFTTTATVQAVANAAAVLALTASSTPNAVPTPAATFTVTASGTAGIGSTATNGGATFTVTAAAVPAGAATTAASFTVTTGGAVRAVAAVSALMVWTARAVSAIPATGGATVQITALGYLQLVVTITPMARTIHVEHESRLLRASA